MGKPKEMNETIEHKTARSAIQKLWLDEDVPEALDDLAGIIQSLAERLRGEDDERLLSASEVAEYLGTSIQWVYRNGRKLGVIKLSHRCSRYRLGRVRAYARMRETGD